MRAGAGPVHLGTLLRTARAIPLVLLTAALPLVATPQAALPRAAAAPLVDLGGPVEIALGQQAHMVADSAEAGATYVWDLDGDGAFETPTGTTNTVDFGFTQGGSTTVSVKVTGSGGVSVDTLDVDVKRPDVSQLILDPANPAPGDKVTLTAYTKTDGKKPVAYVWDVEGSQARSKSAVIGTAQPGLPDQVLDASALGMDVTTKNTLTAVMPKGDKQLGRTLTFTVRIVDEFGGTSTLTTTATLAKPGQMVQKDPYEGKGTIDCDNIPKGVPPAPCAAINYPEGVAGTPMWFTDATPGIKICIPKANPEPNPPLKTLRIDALKDLVYPPAEQFGAVFQQLPGGGVTRTRRSGPLEQDCKTKSARTVSWNFGDGSETVVAEKGLDYSLMEHQYAKPGSYTVTLVTMVPYVLDKNDKFGAGLKYFEAKVTTSIFAQPTHCQPLSLNGLPVTSTSGCFVVHNGLDGATPTYTAQVGYGVRVAGMSLVGASPVVDPTTNVISTPTGVMEGKVTFAEKVGGTTVQVLPPTSVLPIPPPEQDPELGAVVALPALTADPSAPGNVFHGLKVTSRQTYLRAAAPPIERLYTAMPAPLSGSTPPALVLAGTQPSVAARQVTPGGSIPGENTDFEIALDGIEMGGFGIRKGVIAHRVSGGWIASIDQLDVGGLGTLSAPYKKAGATSTDCENIVGPSGIELTEGGAFVRGGAQVIFSPPISLGPPSAPFASLDCIAAQGNADPFVIEGKVGMSVPYQGPIKVDGCLDFGILDQGDQPVGTAVGGCGAAPFTAPSDLLWLRAQGSISLFDVIPLAQAYADLRVGADYASVSAGGRMDYDFANVSVGVTVDGTLVLEPEFAFSLIGQADVCIDFFIDDFCGSAQGGVSSKGFGACVSLGGVVWLKASGWHVFVASCNLKSYLAVQKTLERSARGTTVTAPMPSDLDEAAFVVTSTDGTPRLRITKPDGTVVEDDGTALQELPGLTITRWTRERTTTVTIDSPAAGQWTVEAQPITTCSPRVGCSTTVPPIDVELRTPIPEPEVTGQVVGTGATRSLTYDADLDPGDTLVLREAHGTHSRTLGTAPRGQHSFAIPAAGSAESRTVTAVIERDGIPIRTIELDDYAAPAARPLGVPANVVVDTDGSNTTVTWAPVPGAKRYAVRAQLSDGRVLAKEVTGTSVVLAGVTQLTHGKVTVTALSTVGLDSKAGLRKLTPLKAVKVYY